MADSFSMMDGMGDMRVLDREVARTEPPGENPLIPNVCRETRLAVVDLIRGDEPTTVLGLLISRKEALPVEAVAGWLDRSVEDVQWTLEMLEREDLCTRITHNGIEKVMAFAAFSARNT